MNKFLRFIGPIIASIVRSLFVTGILFIIFLSILTHKFPPRWEDVSQISKLTQQILALGQQMGPLMAKLNSAEKGGLEEVEKLNKKRQQLSKELMNRMGQKSTSQIQDLSEVESQLRQINEHLEKIKSDIEYLKRTR